MRNDREQTEATELTSKRQGNMMRDRERSTPEDNRNVENRIHVNEAGRHLQRQERARPYIV